jgi:multiple sugar transport system substrate-binding protein
MLTRRQLLQGMSAGAAVLALAACAPVGAPATGQQGGAAAPTGTKTTVRVGSWDSVDAEPIEDDVIAAFNEEYPDIEIAIEFNPDAYDDKLLTAMAGGTAPDVFLWWNFPGLVARNGIQDLTELVEGPNGIDPAIYFKEVLDYNRVGDGLYGLPKDFTPRAYYFNKKLFDDAGLPYPTSDWTTNDLLETAKALTKGEGPDKQYGFFTFSDLYALQGYVWQHDGDFISPDGMKATGYADSAATTSVLDWHAAMNLRDGVAPTAQAVADQQGGADQLFTGGKLAMYDTGRWPQTQFKSVEGLEFGTCLPPVDADTGKRVTVLHEAGWCMNPATKMKDGATWEVLRFMAGAQANKIRAQAGWALPALPSVVAELKMEEDPLEKAWFEAIPFATVSPCFMRNANWDKAGSELQVGIDTVFLGKAGAPEAMATAAAAADPILAGS